jgi:hypothetical protein
MFPPAPSKDMLFAPLTRASVANPHDNSYAQSPEAGLRNEQDDDMAVCLRLMEEDEELQLVDSAFYDDVMQTEAERRAIVKEERANMRRMCSTFRVDPFAFHQTSSAERPQHPPAQPHTSPPLLYCFPADPSQSLDALMSRAVHGFGSKAHRDSVGLEDRCTPIISRTASNSLSEGLPRSQSSSSGSPHSIPPFHNASPRHLSPIKQEPFDTYFYERLLSVGGATSSGPRHSRLPEYPYFSPHPANVAPHHCKLSG